MFTFMTSHRDEERSTAAPDDSDSTSTITSLSDASSLVNVPTTKPAGIFSGISRSPHAVSGVGLFSESIANRQRPMLELVDRLRKLGLQSELDLPQIVVIGSQSAGKSSVLEAICGAKFPRNSGTCTRCPIELRMRRTSDTWRCSISLQIMYDENDRLQGSAQSIEFGTPIFNPDGVEDRVRRAQRAILSPSIHPDTFLRGTLTGASELTFSKNYISIQIEGPDVADLSLVDLPGLIASARQGKMSDISLIEDLVISYLEKPSTLILLTVACEADFETQLGHQLVKRYDPKCLRTIGVLTKPDRIATGDEDHWIRFIRNEEEQLELGWFCVKQPDTVQMKKGITWKEAREAEKKFFENTSPWNSLPDEFCERLGTMKLVESLGKTLANLIMRRLPDLRDELEDHLQRTEEDLKYQRVAPAGDSLAEMMRILTAFCAEITQHTEGIVGCKGLIQSINAKQVGLKQSIKSLAPQFKPYKYSESMADLPLPPCELEDWVDDDHKESRSGPTMYIDEVMNMLKESRTRELPDFYPFEVAKQLIRQCTETWEPVVFTYFDEVVTIVYDHYKQLIEDHFKYFESGGLLNIVRMEVISHIKKYREDTQDRLKWLLQFLSRPFTLDELRLAEYKNKSLAYYKMCRYNVINHAPASYIQTHTSGRGVAYVSEVLSSLSKMNMKDVKASDLAKLIPDDEMQPALDLMAIVSAYFQVSSKRFIDFVAVVVDHDFVIALSDNLQTALYSAIITGNAQNKCKEFLKESTAVASRRANLQMKYERLEAAKNELFNMRWRDEE